MVDRIYNAGKSLANEAIEYAKKQKQPKQVEPDFTPKIPSEIAHLTNRSDYDAFDAAYMAIGADIFSEKYPTLAEQKKSR